jgi:hypothetical protein
MSPLIPGTAVSPSAADHARPVAGAVVHPAATVVTRMNLDAPPSRVWGALMFYEEIDASPPLHLRLLLPRPIRTEGSKLAVGDVALCLYDGGHLRKRVTHIESCRYYGFEVLEQQLAIGGSMMLSGGSYALRELPEHTTEVAVTTHYVSRKRPRWLWRPIEAAVCHAFHRHLLRSMRRSVESS